MLFILSLAAGLPATGKPGAGNKVPGRVHKMPRHEASSRCSHGLTVAYRGLVWS